MLPRNEAGRHYQLHVGLPASYAKEPNRRYPVAYVTDGYWDFAKMTTIHGSLVYDRVVPEFVTVGIGYADENPSTASCAAGSCRRCRSTTGMQLEAYTRGLRFAFAPIAPEAGPSTRP